MPTATCPPAHVVEPGLPVERVPIFPTAAAPPVHWTVAVPAIGLGPMKKILPVMPVAALPFGHAVDETFDVDVPPSTPSAGAAIAVELAANAPTIAMIAAVLAHLALIAAPAPVDPTAERYREHREPRVVVRAFSDARLPTCGSRTPWPRAFGSSRRNATSAGALCAGALPATRRPGVDRPRRNRWIAPSARS